MIDVIHYGFYVHQGENWVLQPKGGATVAVDWESQTMGVALCSVLDNFCKRTGRNKALGRLMSKKRWTLYHDLSDQPFEERASWTTCHLRQIIGDPEMRIWFYVATELFADYPGTALAMTRKAILSQAEIEELDRKSMIVVEP